MKKLLSFALVLTLIISCVSMVTFTTSAATGDPTVLEWSGLDTYQTFHGAEAPDLFDTWNDDGTNYTTTMTVKNTGTTVIYNFKPYVQDNWGSTIGTTPANNKHIYAGEEMSFTISVPKSYTFSKIILRIDFQTPATGTKIEVTGIAPEILDLFDGNNGITVTLPEPDPTPIPVPAGNESILTWGGLGSYVTYHGVEIPNLFDTWNDDGTNYTTTIKVKNVGTTAIYNFCAYVQDNWGATIGTVPASNQHIYSGEEKSFTISVPKSHAFSKIIFRLDFQTPATGTKIEISGIDNSVMAMFNGNNGITVSYPVVVTPTPAPTATPVPTAAPNAIGVNLTWANGAFTPNSGNNAMVGGIPNFLTQITNDGTNYNVQVTIKNVGDVSVYNTVFYVYSGDYTSWNYSDGGNGRNIMAGGTGTYNVKVPVSKIDETLQLRYEFIPGTDGSNLSLDITSNIPYSAFHFFNGKDGVTVTDILPAATATPAPTEAPTPAPTATPVPTAAPNAIGVNLTWADGSFVVNKGNNAMVGGIPNFLSQITNDGTNYNVQVTIKNVGTIPVYNTVFYVYSGDYTSWNYSDGGNGKNIMPGESRTYNVKVPVSKVDETLQLRYEFIPGTDGDKLSLDITSNIPYNAFHYFNGKDGVTVTDILPATPTPAPTATPVPTAAPNAIGVNLTWADGSYVRDKGNNAMVGGIPNFLTQITNDGTNYNVQVTLKNVGDVPVYNTVFYVYSGDYTSWNYSDGGNGRNIMPGESRTYNVKVPVSKVDETLQLRYEFTPGKQGTNLSLDITGNIPCNAFYYFNGVNGITVTDILPAAGSELIWGGLDSYLTYHGIENATALLENLPVDAEGNKLLTYTVYNTGEHDIYNFQLYVQDSWAKVDGMTAPKFNIYKGASRTATVKIPADYNFGNVVLRMDSAEWKTGTAIYITGIDNLILENFEGQNGITVNGIENEDLEAFKPAYKIEGASLDLSSSLTLNYYLTLSDEYKDIAVLRITREDKVVEITEKELVDGYYVFRYTGINPQCMGDVIRAELICGKDGEYDKVVDVKEDYSVRQYAINRFNAENATEEEKVLLADMLQYGAQSQLYQNYKTEELITEGSDVADIMAMASDFVVPETIKNIVGNQDTSNRITSAGVRISNVYQIYFRITKEANTKVFLQVGNKEKVDVTDKLENGSLYTDAIKATENDKVFTVSLVKDGEAEATSTITYSINSYVNSKYDSVQIGDLVKAISNYGKSANAYQSK